MLMKNIERFTLLRKVDEPKQNNVEMSKSTWFINGPLLCQKTIFYCKCVSKIIIISENALHSNVGVDVGLCF